MCYFCGHRADRGVQVQKEGRTLRVVIAEDHPIYREGLARMLRHRREFELAASCRDGVEALTAIAATSPDVALIDVWMPGTNGIEVLRELQRNDESETRVVMLTAADDGATVYEAVAAGAAGYILKDADHAQVCEALLAVAAGRTVLPAEVQTRLAGEIRHRSEPPVPLLTPRETEVLRLTADGRSVREVADELVLSAATVKTHLQHIYQNLGVSDRASAVAEAMRHGIID
jgi:two-component system nitrate/nitrite response regulator NarL